MPSLVGIAAAFGTEASSEAIEMWSRPELATLCAEVGRYPRPSTNLSDAAQSWLQDKTRVAWPGASLWPKRSVLAPVQAPKSLSNDSIKPCRSSDAGPCRGARPRRCARGDAPSSALALPDALRRQPLA